MRLISRVTLNLFNKKAAVSHPAQRGGADVGQLPHYLFCSRQTKFLKTRRNAASPTPGIARGLLHERDPALQLPAAALSVGAHRASGPWAAETQLQTLSAFHTTQNQQQTSSPPPSTRPLHVFGGFGVFL